MSTEDQLIQINKAISAIENGAQEYQIGSRKIRKADLSVLYRERRNLQSEIAEQNNHSCYVARFDRR